METLELLGHLKNPRVYGNDVKSVVMLQTHISFVALTGKFAYKVKKPVNFDFLDFSTIEKRKHFCEEELRLNKRLCPDLYLDVVSITVKDNHLEINGDGKVVDYAVKMKEFPQEKIMTKLLEKGKIDEELIKKICYILVEFYKKGERSSDIDSYGTIKSIKMNTDENFEQTESFVDITIPQKTYHFIKKATNEFLNQKKKVIEERIKNGFIRDCHGDLHSGNIVVLKDDICIFDCIEFNNRFRYSDIASDIGFLAMDLDFLGRPYLSSYLIEQYSEKSGDFDIFHILNFYKCYRAYVRGKVIGFKLNDPTIDRGEKQKIIETANKYFDLAYYYSELFSRDLTKDTRPILFITSGLTGTGKTTLARKISVDYHANIISSDAVRKEIEGVDKYERHHEEYNTGLYSPNKMLYTYEKIMEKAEVFLKKGENVILDATFKTQELRDMAKKLANENNTFFLVLYCNCPENIVKQYLKERVKKKSISNGRWEIYVRQKDSFEPFKLEDNVIEVDISSTSYNYHINVFRNILKKTI
jgi:aminoglycoside phosphotransferase family enzyme/predicted kinase